MNKLYFQKIEFAGFLKGEGCFRVDKKVSLAKKRGWKTSILYTPQINISLRDDDAEILKWAKEHYGGTLIHRRGRPQIKNQNDYYMWALNSASGCLRVLDDFLKANLPSKKIQQANLLREFCILKIRRWKRGHKGRKQRWYSDEEIKYMENSYKTLKRLKLYNER